MVIFVDGPHKPEERSQVEACRTLARQVDWVETELFLWEENRGLNGLLDNISLVFEKYSSAVFLEDDCLPMPGFYHFMRKALEHYQAEDQVFSIGGYQPVWFKHFHDYHHSLVSSPRFICWGWATWRERWQQVLPYAVNYATLFDGLRTVPEFGGADLPPMARALAAGEIKASWAIKVDVACMWLKMVHLLPVHGLVRNIGMDYSGVHGGFLSRLRSSLFYNKNITSKPLKELIWLDNVTVNDEYAQHLQDFVAQVQRFSAGYWKLRMKKFMCHGDSGLN